MLHAMNRKRRIVVVAYFLAMAAASTYVPWVLYAPYGNEVSRPYHWITKVKERVLVPLPPGAIDPNSLTSTPGAPTFCEMNPKMEGCSPKYQLNRWEGTVSYGRLAIEYIAITAIFMALFLALPNRPRKSDSAGPNP